jgi:hypothetical protein
LLRRARSPAERCPDLATLSPDAGPTPHRSDPLQHTPDSCKRDCWEVSLKLDKSFSAAEEIGIDGWTAERARIMLMRWAMMSSLWSRAVD